MYKIKIFSDFCSSEECKKNYEIVNNVDSLDYYGENKKVFITTGDDFTHAIIVNQAMPNLNLPKKNIIGLAFEPIEFLGLTTSFVEYAQKYIHKYYIGSKYKLPEPFIEGFSFMWYDSPKKIIEISQKKKIMSIIISEKTFAPGHMYRHKLVEKILENNLPIDIYGRGCFYYKEYSSIKGEFISEEPYEEYFFSICIENFCSNHYFSEKIMNPIMYNCLPIYLGCRKILDYINKDNIILLSGEIEEDIKKIELILQNPEKYYQISCIEKYKKIFNLIDNLDNIFL
jgi:hypothetical protein